MAHMPLTVGIVTRNRPDALARCLESLAVLGDRVAHVIVVDDTGDVPLDGALARGPAGRVRLVRQEHREGPIVARNTILREATTETILLMDDDAALLPGGHTLDALELLEDHPRIGSVACAMAGLDGSPWHISMQPAPVDYTCYVAAYIGFAHFIRRSAFLAAGGYRESFVFYGEEKDLCMRMLQAGYDVVYTPHVRVVHEGNLAGRSNARYVRHVVRNDCLFALYNEPWPMLVVSLPVRLSRYFRMSGGLRDRGGFRWILGEVWRTLPDVAARRAPVSWATLARWRRVARTWPAFAPDAA
jgi:GT2 family glycosyltransferase